MASITRRVLLRLLALASASVPLLPARAAPLLGGIRQAPSSADRLSALGPFLDTLIPADEESPAATAVGVEEGIRQAASNIPGYSRLLQVGCAWLDDAASRRRGTDFAGLATSDREAVVAALATSAAESAERAFFDRCRREAMTRYYADPRSWAALGYRGPPQPAGYPDFDRPPTG